MLGRYFPAWTGYLLTAVTEIILASASPRRAELLSQLGIRFRIVPASINEAVRADELPSDYVQRIANEKAEAVFASESGIILSADTSVVLGKRIFGKPACYEEAADMLLALSGRRHEVLTAVTLMDGERAQHVLQKSEVTFAQISRKWIDWYWKTGEPADKAGAYAIQGFAASHISDLKGSYSGVMGLPLYETAELLRAFGVKIQSND